MSFFFRNDFPVQTDSRYIRLRKKSIAGRGDGAVSVRKTNCFEMSRTTKQLQAVCTCLLLLCFHIRIKKRVAGPPPRRQCRLRDVIVVWLHSACACKRRLPRKCCSTYKQRNRNKCRLAQQHVMPATPNRSHAPHCGCSHDEDTNTLRYAHYKFCLLSRRVVPKCFCPKLSVSVI